MNKKTISMDDIIRFSEGYDDEFIDEEVLEEEFIEKDSFFDSRVNFKEENFNNNSFYGESSCEDEYSEELIFDLATVEDDDECEYNEEYNQEHYTRRSSNNYNEYNTAEAYYTQCNHSFGFGNESPVNIEECEAKQDDYEECNNEDNGSRQAYDEGYENGYRAGYERAKQEVIEYINKRKKKNKCCRKCCCKCCCRNN